MQEMFAMSRSTLLQRGISFFYGQTDDRASANDRKLARDADMSAYRTHTIASPSDYKIWSCLCIPVSQSNRRNTGWVS